MTMFLALVDRFGFAAGVAVLAFSGACEMAPFLFGKFGIMIPEAFAHGLGKVGGAAALGIFGRNYAKSEAEKRIANPQLGQTSVVPSIQKQMDVQNVAIATGTQPRPTNGIRKP